MSQKLSSAIALIFAFLLNLQKFFKKIFKKFFDWLICVPSHIFKKCQNTPKLCQLVINIAIGLSVLGILTFFQAEPWLRDAEDASLDFAMQFHQDSIPPAKEKNIPPFVFLDIDDQTYKLWGEPLFAPRNKVKQLIEVAVKGGARLVIVDVDLSKKTPIDGLQLDGQQHQYDQDLYDYIGGYKTNCQEKTCPPIILERAFRPLPESSVDGEKTTREPRIGFLEDAVSKSTPYIQWASPLFQKSSSDGAVRRWGLWQYLCVTEKKEKKSGIIPSTQLLAAAMIHHDTPQQASDKINAELARFKQKVCGDEPLAKPTLSKPIKFAEGLEITEGMYGISQRIVYNMPWIPPQSISEKWMLRYSLRDYDKETQKSRVILTVFSAQPYLDSPEAGTFKDKIVVIGSSYSDGGELHSTPLGTMPGGLVIINAIHSLLQYGAMKPSLVWYKGLAILFIIVVSILVTFFNPSFWVILFSGIGIILLALISSFLFVEGVWINFALPLLAILIPQIVIRFNEIAKDVESRQQKSTKLERKIKRKVEKSIEESLAKQIRPLLAQLDLDKLVRDVIKQSIEPSEKNGGDSETGPKKSESLQWLKRQGHKLYQWIKTLFSHLLSSPKSLIINLLLGLGVALLLLSFSDSPWLMDTEDASMDWFMRLNQNIIPSIQNNNIPPVVMLDIDDKTYYNWGEPLFTPREQLKNLIAAAVEAKARLVIVDLEVSQKTPVEGSQLHPSDQALKDYLANYIVECKGKIDNCPTIILKRTFSSEPSPIPILLTSFLDDIVTTQAAPYVQWASAQFYPAKNQVVRRWKLWQPVCTSNKQPLVIPSIELLVMSLVKEDCITQDVQNALQSFKPKNCDNNNATSSHEIFKLCDLPINTKDRWSINQRIMYPMSWLDSVTDEVDMPVLTILSAKSYTTESLPQTKLKTLTDNIVVIGKSYREGYDIHSTPLGKMPGALIIVNAIHSVLQYEKIEQSPIVGLLTTMLFLVIATALFGIFPSSWGMTVLGIVIIFVLLPFTMVLFHYGMWFNIALPLIVVSIIRVVYKYNQSPIPKQSAD